jgi:uncharacterized protein DUF1488
MPLTPDPGRRYSNVDLFAIRFPMFDGAKQVNCTVTSEALQDMAAPDDRHLEPVEALFEFYRSRVEEIASQKYDDDFLIDGEVLVVNSDV